MKKLGPWTVESVVAGPPEREGFQIMDGDDVLVEMFEGNGWNKTQIQKILNLMAAAPDMLEALQDVWDAGVFECCCGAPGGACDGTCTYTRVKLAIAKAEGKT